MKCRELWAWANDPEVRKAIHAAPVEVAGRFDECAGRIRYTHDAGSMVHIHQKLVAAGEAQAVTSLIVCCIMHHP